MDRRLFLSLTASAGAAMQIPPLAAQVKSEASQILPGVWRFSLGTSESITTVKTRRYSPAQNGFKTLPAVTKCPVKVVGQKTQRGYLLSLPLQPYELVYGLGLQLQSFIQRGLKKKLRVNADPVIDSGDTHAPVPFYVTTGGYGVLVDTARYATFYCGNKRRKKSGQSAAEPAESSTQITKDALPAAYGRYRFGEASEVLVEIPEAGGVDVYVFGGPTMREAVQRYNLFSGGGALPPRWGLGIWYRCEKDFGQNEVLRQAAEFRERRLPCDVIGLEPGWQTHAYSCSYVWNKKFADPGQMLKKLAEKNYRVNLWEHAFTHPTSPIYQQLFPYSGDYEVWDGLVPDFLTTEGRKIFADFHEREHVTLGVSGYKLDECDNSDFTRNWSFPEISRFPSGADGEQMHSLFGLRYQDTIQSIYEKRQVRTYGLVRSSQALAAPYPYVLYSDLYDHAQFIRAIPKAGFSGLLWTPEVRDAKSHEDLIRRLQSVIFSPMALINAWYIKNPPWKQIDQKANNADQLDPAWEKLEEQCRQIFALRMRLVPYLHAAFVRYHKEGLPPFRALVMDYPKDAQTWAVDDQYLVGDSLMIAPVTAEQHERTVYLPEGAWHDYWNQKIYQGQQTIKVSVPLEQIPIYVKSGTLLPLGNTVLHTDDPASGKLTIMIFGDGATSTSLYEEDGSTNPEFTEVQLSWSHERKQGLLKRSGPKRNPSYEAIDWQQIK